MALVNHKIKNKFKNEYNGHKIIDRNSHAEDVEENSFMCYFCEPLKKYFICESVNIIGKDGYFTAKWVSNSFENLNNIDGLSINGIDAKYFKESRGDKFYDLNYDLLPILDEISKYVTAHPNIDKFNIGTIDLKNNKFNTKL